MLWLKKTDGAGEEVIALKKRWWIVLLAVLLLAAAAFFAWALGCYHADAAALAALASDTVSVEETDFGWRFDGPAEDAVLVFYPGGNVDETAYAPLLHRAAEGCMDVCLVKMPFHLAFFGADRADAILARYDYEKRYIGGHSLGGAVAALYAAGHELDGVILLAAYPTKDVDEPMLIVYGSEDGVLNRARVGEAPRYGAVDEVVIEGGNHAGFGNYGAQKGDGFAAIGAEEQQKETVEAIAAWLG